MAGVLRIKMLRIKLLSERTEMKKERDNGNEHTTG